MGKYMNAKKIKGGYREGAGRKKGRPTTVLRVPECYQSQVRSLIAFLDDDKRKFGGTYEIPVMTSPKTGKKMVLSFVLEEYSTDRLPLSNLFG